MTDIEVNSAVFLEPLVDAGFDHPRLKALASDPEKVIRISSLRNFENQKSLENEKVGLRLLKELDRDFGIKVPEHHAVIGPSIYPDDYNEALYMIVDRVHGVNIKDASFAPEQYLQMQGKLDVFYSKLVAYYKYKFENGGDYLTDLRRGQFMYGATKNKPEPEVYLVDLDLHHMKVVSPNRDGGTFFDIRFENVAEMIFRSELQIGGLKLDQARTDLIDFFSNVSPDSYFSGSLPTINLALEGMDPWRRKFT